MADNVTFTEGATSPPENTVIATDEVASAHYQYVKMAFGGDGTATKLSGVDPLPVDTELPAAAALADAAANPTAPTVGANGSWFNGTTWERVRNNTEGTLLASAARTGTTSSATQTNHNARGVVIAINITNAGAGTGTLAPALRLIDPISGTGGQINVATATTAAATGLSFWIVYPGISTLTGSTKAVSSVPLARSWLLTVVHSDASTITYSAAYMYIV
jgi:hypothetical protein